MDDSELERRIEVCRAKYVSEFRMPCNYFYCPILLRDEKVEMCRAHITNKAFKVSDRWVPQRKDVDNFYGSAIEARFVNAIEDFDKSADEMLLNLKCRRRHEPKIEYEGKEIEYYLPKGTSPNLPGQTTVNLTSANEQLMAKLKLKIPVEELSAKEHHEMTLIVDRDYRYYVVGAVLKAAHLTMFDIFGYEYVVSSSGTFLASILGQFYKENLGSHSVSESAVKNFFSQHESMVSRLEVEDENSMLGSIEDSMFLKCYTSSNIPFILGVTVRILQHRFCVFMSTGHEIDAYFSFLKNRPLSIRARFTKYNSVKSAWEDSPVFVTIPLGQPTVEK